MTWYNPFSWFRSPKPDCVSDFTHLLTKIEPTDTPFLRQVRNKNDLFVLNGQKFTSRQLEAVFDIKAATIRGRIYAGWSIEDAVKTPVRKWTKRTAHETPVFNRPGWPS